MTRPGPFERIYNLAIGDEATAWPKPGEPIEKALQRIKVRLAKYAAEGRYFRAKIEGNAIRVQRTCEGQNTKIGDWLMMKAGDRLLLKTNPTPADIKKARGSCDYINGRGRRKVGHLPLPERRSALKAIHGGWIIVPDRQGRLVVECFEDTDGKMIDHSLGDAAPLRQLWAGEWP
ncbi:hypothetical protein [Sphingomonas sp.]|uniref:hypothetical protein n=1 Tax=Sphingomonas sp. TaxID=28214 RepID=UPI00289DB297|nr:hypothetical protein [Sphingomonas sp.]